MGKAHKEKKQASNESVWQTWRTTLQTIRRTLGKHPQHTRGFVLGVLLDVLIKLLLLSERLVFGSVTEEMRHMVLPEANSTVDDETNVRLPSLSSMVRRNPFTLLDEWRNFNPTHDDPFVRWETLLFALAIIFGLQVLFVAARTFFTRSLRQQMVVELHRDLVAHMLELDVVWFDKHASGALSSLSENIFPLVHGTFDGTRKLVVMFTSIGLGVASLVSISPTVALYLVVAVPFGLVYMYLLSFVQRLEMNVSDEFQVAKGQSAAVTTEIFANIRTVVTSGRQEQAIQRYNRVQESVCRALRRKAWVEVASWTSGFVTTNLVGWLTLWGAAYAIVGANLSLGDTVRFVLVVQQLGSDLECVPEYLGLLASASGAGRAVFEVLDRAPARPPCGQASPLGGLVGDIEFESVVFAYEGRENVPVLRTANWRVRPRQVVGLVAPSGSGKSTVCSLLLRLIDPVKGRILLDGRSNTDYDLRWLRDQFAVVEQTTSVFDITLRENIAFTRPDASDEEIRRAASDANLIDWIDSLRDGLDTVAGEAGVTLSGGQKQRIGVARALLSHASIVILDEPTASLDTENARIVRGALRRLVASRTAIIVTHSPEDLDGLDCDIVYGLVGGEFERTGTGTSVRVSVGDVG